VDGSAEGAAAPTLPEVEAARHELQRRVVLLAAPLWVPLAAFYLRVVRGYRIRGLARLRADFARIRGQVDGPLLLCANHLTLVDSFLVNVVLVSPWRMIVQPRLFAWNVPEMTNFAASRAQALFTYIAKCIPIARGGTREHTALVLKRVMHLLSRGELALIFPEGGRSRSGRVDVESAAWGVGRIVVTLPSCRVACLYLRGDAQRSWGAVPARGDRFTAQLVCIEPKSDHRGARRSRDIARQITAQLAQMEKEYFDGRK
jgi:hypothetical protein